MDELVRVAVMLASLALPPDSAAAADPAAYAQELARGQQQAYGQQQPVPLQVTAAWLQQQPVPLQVTDAWFGSDKFRHFWMSYAATAFSFAAVRALGQDTDGALLVAVPAAAAAGVGKEIFDRRAGGIFSVRDLVADGLGVAAAYFLLREVR